MAMTMATASEAHYEGQTINYLNICGRQTINLLVTPDSFDAGNNFARDSFNITRLHKIYAFIIPVFIGLLQILTQGNTTTLFQVHPVTTTASVLCILGYYLAVMASLRLPFYATRLSVVMGVFGSLSLASLVTLLLPDSWWHIRSIFYVLLAVVELHQLLKVLYDKYLRRFILTTRSWPPQSARRLLPLSYMDVR